LESALGDIRGPFLTSIFSRSAIFRFVPQRQLFLFYCCCDCIRRQTFDVIVGGGGFFSAGPRTVGLNV
jgi:hypothetical protein